MTTINNLTIEQMREIVSGAPDRAEAYSLQSKTYYYSPSQFFDFDENKWVEMDRGVDLDLYESFFWLDDLRTAIAKHDSREFKVGDLVVCTDDFVGRRDLTAKDIALFLTVKKITAFIDDWGLELNDGAHWVDTYRFRHATPAEIKAGHRIDDTTDHVTDIRNHVSPSTRVVDL